MIPSDSVDEPFSMKPMLSKCIDEAFRWALADSCVEPPKSTSQDELDRYDKRIAEIVLDPYCITESELLHMDIIALSQNICVRLLGLGGWQVNSTYGGNASVQQMVDASFSRPSQDPIADVVMDLGLKRAPEDDEQKGDVRD